MRTAFCTAAAVVALATTGCTTYEDRYDYRAYDYNRPDPRYGGYYPDRYYRSGDGYVLSENDRVYRGQDGRYYCRRPDGTTGLVVGGAIGGTLGAVIAPGGSELLGALLGGTVGAVVGREVDRDNDEVRCN